MKNKIKDIELINNDGRMTLYENGIWYLEPDDEFTEHFWSFSEKDKLEDFQISNADFLIIEEASSKWLENENDLKRRIANMEKYFEEKS